MKETKRSKQRLNAQGSAKKRNTSSKKTTRRPFILEIPELAPGQKHPELKKVQIYLGRSGYLKDTYESSKLDEPTRKALKRFQRFRGLKQTGTTNQPTVEGLKTPKCGYPDQPERRARARAAITALAAAAAPNLSIGCDYRPVTQLTYTFVNRTSDLGPDLNKVSAAIARAFATWQAAIPMDFVRVDGPEADLKFGWFSGSHGDGDDFDFIGGVIAHAFPPPPCGASNAGLCHFDESEKWGRGHSADPPRMFDLETQALHEIGHLLGLTHSSDPTSIMFTDYRFVPHVQDRRKLSPDAKTAIQRIYGSRDSA